MTYASLVKPVAAVAATLLLGVATAVAVSEPAPDAAPGGDIAVAEGELTLDVQATPAGGQTEEPSAVPVEIAASNPPSTTPVQPPTRFLDQWEQPPGAAPSLYRLGASDPNYLQRDVLVARDPRQPDSVPRPGERGLM